MTVINPADCKPFVLFHLRKTDGTDLVGVRSDPDGDEPWLCLEDDQACWAWNSDDEITVIRKIFPAPPQNDDDPVVFQVRASELPDVERDGSLSAQGDYVVTTGPLAGNSVRPLVDGERSLFMARLAARRHDIPHRVQEKQAAAAAAAAAAVHRIGLLWVDLSDTQRADVIKHVAEADQ